MIIAGLKLDSQQKPLNERSAKWLAGQGWWWILFKKGAHADTNGTGAQLDSLQLFCISAI